MTFSIEKEGGRRGGSGKHNGASPPPANVTYNVYKSSPPLLCVYLCEYCMAFELVYPRTSTRIIGVTVAEASLV